MQAIAGKIIHLLLKDVKKIDVLKEFRSSVTFNQVFSSRFLQLSTPRHWIPQRCPVRDSPVPGDNSQPWRSPKATPQVPELLNVFQKLNSSRSQGHRHKFNMKWRWSEGILKNWDRNGKNKRNMQKKTIFQDALLPMSRDELQWDDPQTLSTAHLDARSNSSRISTENICHETFSNQKGQLFINFLSKILADRCGWCKLRVLRVRCKALHDSVWLVWISPSNLARSLWCHGHVRIRWSPGWWKRNSQLFELLWQMIHENVPTAYTIALFDFSFLCLTLTCPVLPCFPSNILGGFILSSSPRRWWSLVASQAHFLSYVICNFVGLRPGTVDVEFWLHSQLSRCCLRCPNWNESQTLISHQQVTSTFWTWSWPIAH